MDLVFLHGPAAAGKLTVARALSERTNFRVFHNHLIVDAVTAVFPFGSAPFVKLREQFWLATFAEAAASDTSLIFTFAPESTVPAGLSDRTRRVVEAAGGRIHFVQLAVSEAEQERRIDLPSRHEFEKLTDLETLRRIRASKGTLDIPQTDLLIDTEESDPDAAAQLIIDAFALKPVAAHQRYA
ncbi:MAG: hypothetical protein ACTHON_02705 [Humibacter sp.]